MFRRTFLVSKWIHLYLGLLVFLYLIVVSATGILLNHPRLLAGCSVPRWMVPPSYRIADWSRGSLKKLAFSKQDLSAGFLAGTEGVWKTSDDGVTFEPMETGYPGSRAYRRTVNILLKEDEMDSLLLAGTREGLFACSLQDERWRPIALGENHEEIRRILRVGDRIVVFSDSYAYESPAADGADSLQFRPVSLARMESDTEATEKGISLVRLMFALHGGELWGLPGRLLIDLTGLILIFLSMSAIYMWYFPRARRWFSRKPGNAHAREVAKRRAYAWMTNYHLDLGALAALLLIVIAATALFMPPSPLVLLAIRTTVPREYWPGPLPSDPWHEAIGNAAYDAARGEILIEANKAIWRGPADFSKPFTRDTARPPVSSMGTNVMEVTDDGGLLVGSFSGLFECRPDGKTVIDLSTGSPRQPGRSGRPLGSWLAVGYFETPGGERFVATHRQGLVGIEGAERAGRFQMPEAMAEGYRMPLWSFLFEIHNGRIVRDWIGDSHYLISLLGALSLLVITFTGLNDWVYRKLRRRGGKNADGKPVIPSASKIRAASEDTETSVSEPLETVETT